MKYEDLKISIEVTPSQSIRNLARHLVTSSTTISRHSKEIGKVKKLHTVHFVPYDSIVSSLPNGIQGFINCYCKRSNEGRDKEFGTRGKNEFSVFGFRWMYVFAWNLNSRGRTLSGSCRCLAFSPIKNPIPRNSPATTSPHFASLCELFEHRLQQIYRGDFRGKFNRPLDLRCSWIPCLTLFRPILRR